MVVALLFAAR